MTEEERHTRGRAIVSYCQYFDHYVSQHAASGAPEPLELAAQLLESAADLAEWFDGDERERLMTAWIDKRLRVLVALRPFVGMKRGSA